MENRKIAVVTGANTGLGYETSLGLVKKGFHVVLACRNESKAAGAIARIQRAFPEGSSEFLQLDLIDREGIRHFAKIFGDRHDRLDLLVNNAGVMGPPRTITQNDVELQFDANHLGHFLLTSLLVDQLYKGEDARIVNVSSLAAKFEGVDIFFDNLNFEGNYDEGPDFMGLSGMMAYGQSKLANVLFTMELANRFAAAGKNVMAVTAHPGASNTDLSRNMSFMIRFLAPLLVKFMNVSTPAEGAESLLLAALGSNTDPGDFIGPTGKQERTGPAGKCELPPHASDEKLREKLWAISEELLGTEFKI